MTSSAYDPFAPDYHWIFSDDHIRGERFLLRYEELLASLPPRAQVLDCACGTGVEALALARMGFGVTASDASEGMVAETRRLFTEAGLEAKIQQCSWDRLAEVFPVRFDAVFCTGNSLGHCGGTAGMLAALCGMHAVLGTGGVIVVESRDWEKMYAERPRLEVRTEALVRDGVRGFPLYIWTVPDRWGEPCSAEVVILLEEGNQVTHRVVELSFTPYRRSELLEGLETIGFERQQVVDDRPGWYFVTATKRS